MKRILFIGHNASRTGAPLVLLHLLRWLRANNSEIKLDLLLLDGGELEREYRDVAEVFMVPKPKRTILRRLADKVDRSFGSEEAAKLALPRMRGDYYLVVGNTVATLEYLALFRKTGFRTISWLHELEYIVTSILTKERFLELCQSVDQFIVPSSAVVNMLKRFELKQPTHIVYEFSPIDPNERPDAAAVRESLGISESSFVVLGSGTIEWRKGVDLFLYIASRVYQRRPDISFIWLGGPPGWDDSDLRRVKFDLERLGLHDKVVITGHRPDPHRYIASADVFALTSREDPFPLVCLEAAAFGKPIICFAGAGGIPEFVGDDAGAIVPYADTDTFAEKIIEFSGRPDIAEMGARARQKLEHDFSFERSCSRINEILGQ